MVNKYQLGTGRAIKIKFEETKATAFGGLALAERVASRVSFWTRLEKYLPKRKGQYNWIEVIKSAAAGLLTGSQGTYASEDIRRDEAALSILGLSRAPEEATFWRCLEGLGEHEMQKNLGLFYRDEVRRILERARRRDIQVEGFIPVWGDGSLLEGSRRREGTKHIEGKGDGLLWTTIYVGPILASQELAKEGEGESTVFKKLLPDVVKDILKPLRFMDRTLLFLDSLHGDGPTLDMAEREGLHYLVGANKLSQTRNVLQSQPEMVWESLGAEPEKKISEKAVCVCQIQCSNWSHSRTLVGMRWEYEGDFIKYYAGVINVLSLSKDGFDGE